MNIEALCHRKSDNDNNKRLEIITPTHMNNSKEFIKASQAFKSIFGSEHTGCVFFLAVTAFSMAMIFGLLLLWLFEVVIMLLFVYMRVLRIAMCKQHVSFKFN